MVTETEGKEPRTVRVSNVALDSEYVQWVGDIVGRYKSAQIKTVVKVNTEKLRWNWELGHDLAVRKAEEKWGSGIVEQLSLDLRSAFPHDKGFSCANLFAMKRWYLFFSKHDVLEKLYQLGKELLASDNQQRRRIEQRIITAAPISDSDFPEVLGLAPWRHQLEIIRESKNADEVIFYLRQTIIKDYSRADLLNAIKGNLYNNQGHAITNFTEKLSLSQATIAQEITKENYDLGFITLPEKYKETQLENELERNITRFLLELGTGFSFVGRQKEIIIGGKSRYIDMLFFHIQLRCYVVCELKCTPFEPEFASKLNFYVNAVDELIKTDDQNPTIGLLICSDKNETEVRWSFKGIQTPMGVASYSNIHVVDPSNYLPSAEELQKRIALMEEQLKRD